LPQPKQAQTLMTQLRIEASKTLNYCNAIEHNKIEYLHKVIF